MNDGYYDAWMENPMAKTLKQSHQDTHPQPKREWVGLTDEEMKRTCYEACSYDPYTIARAIEVKLKEKNA